MTKELILSLCQNGKDSLERTFAAVPDDKVSWQPAEGARSALDGFGDAAQTMLLMAKMIDSKGGEIPPMNRDFFMQLKAERAGWTRENATTQYELGWSHFKGALELLSDEDLAKPVTLPMRGGMTAPLASWVMMVYRTCISRFAQINYIQTLYGDLESH
ncbi:DUF1572 domain-containing protein [bacterium]|nr:MAG: DUF1572 domain-containing protein [bacterium]